jgi:energy-coupling factor transporter ATP-binding protein EcfA2
MSVVINIRGTSGSGKSTLVTRLMELYETRIHNRVDGRKQPISTLLSRPGAVPLYVPGHYNTACGGCDTIKTVDGVYDLVTEAANAGCHVVYEGIMVMDDVVRATRLAQKHALTVIALSTPIGECVAAVRGRREARGDPRPLDPKNTIARAERCERGLSRLRVNGVKVERADREAAFLRVAELLGVAP